MTNMARSLAAVLAALAILSTLAAPATANSTTFAQRSLAALGATERALLRLEDVRADAGAAEIARVRAAAAAQRREIVRVERELAAAEAALAAAERATRASRESILGLADEAARAARGTADEGRVWDRVVALVAPKPASPKPAADIASRIEAARTRLGSLVRAEATERARVADIAAMLAPRTEILAELDAALAQLDLDAAEARALRERASAAAARDDASAATIAAGADASRAAATRIAARLGIAPAPWPLRMPAAGEVSSPFGPRGAEFHEGIDIATPYGAPVVAIAAGTVTIAGRPYLASGDDAVVVVVDHGDGFVSTYGHLTPELAVRPGQAVAAGEVIGAVGLTGRTTGPHLHFMLTFEGQLVDPSRVLAAPVAH